MHISVSIPLDNDGFLRRECPSCHQQFKWHNGPANEEAERQPAAETYFCPFCGVATATSAWATAEQQEYIREMAMPAAVQALDDELGAMFRGMSSRNFNITKTGHLDVPDEPTPMTEPDDMMIVASPCHGWEPVKLPEDTAAPVYCLVCGTAFAL